MHPTPPEPAVGMEVLQRLLQQAAVGPSTNLAIAHEEQRPAAPLAALVAPQQAIVTPSGPAAGLAQHSDALSFWLQLYQISLSGLQNALQQAQCAFPALTAALPGAGQHGTQQSSAAGALQALAALGSLSPLLASASAAVAVAAGPSAAPGVAPAGAGGVGGPAAAAASANQQLRNMLDAYQLMSTFSGGADGSEASLATATAAVTAAAASAPPPAPDLTVVTADPTTVVGFGTDWSNEPSSTDGSQEMLQRKRMRRAVETRACGNCGTNNTPFWRKDRHTGQSLCNACGLYSAKNDAPRPVKLWREGQMMPPGNHGHPNHLPPTASAEPIRPQLHVQQQAAGTGAALLAHLQQQQQQPTQQQQHVYVQQIQQGEQHHRQQQQQQWEQPRTAATTIVRPVATTITTGRLNLPSCLHACPTISTGSLPTMAAAAAAVAAAQAASEQQQPLVQRLAGQMAELEAAMPTGSVASAPAVLSSRLQAALAAAEGAAAGAAQPSSPTATLATSQQQPARNDSPSGPVGPHDELTAATASAFAAAFREAGFALSRE